MTIQNRRLGKQESGAPKRTTCGHGFYDPAHCAKCVENLRRAEAAVVREAVWWSSSEDASVLRLGGPGDRLICAVRRLEKLRSRK
jgi:hypothetical protein